MYAHYHHHGYFQYFSGAKIIGKKG